MYWKLRQRDSVPDTPGVLSGEVRRDEDVELQGLAKRSENTDRRKTLRYARKTQGERENV